jgi:hypothetical protein
LLEATKGKEAQMAALWLKLEARAAEVTDLQQRNKKLQEDHIKSAHENAELESALTRLQAKLLCFQEEKEQLQVGNASFSICILTIFWCFLLSVCQAFACHVVARASASR